MIQGLLGQEHVPQVAVPVAGITRQSLAVVERQSGRQYRFLLPGPPLAEGDQDRVLGALAAHAGGAHFIVASGSLPPGVADDFYARVRSRWRGPTMPALCSTARGTRCSVPAPGSL